MLTGAETGWADDEVSNAARQKYPVVTPATTRAEIRNASDVTRIRGSIWFRPDGIPRSSPLPLIVGLFRVRASSDAVLACGFCCVQSSIRGAHQIVSGLPVDQLGDAKA
jgi:hypothetical protein